jgi:hypothetical protein
LFYKLKHFDEHQSTIENIINGNFEYCRTWGCLKKQIANKRHMNCLPNYNVEIETSLNRMPSFNLSNNNWNAIIAAFQDMEDNDLSYESIHLVDKKSEKYKQGYQLASDYGYYDLEKDEWIDAFNEGSRCYVCHFNGAVPPGKDFAISEPLVWAPNLSLSKERLRPEWIKEWLRNSKIFTWRNSSIKMTNIAS